MKKRPNDANLPDISCDFTHSLRIRKLDPELEPELDPQAQAQSQVESAVEPPLESVLEPVLEPLREVAPEDDLESALPAMGPTEAEIMQNGEETMLAAEQDLKMKLKTKMKMKVKAETETASGGEQRKKRHTYSDEEDRVGHSEGKKEEKKKLINLSKKVFNLIKQEKAMNGTAVIPLLFL